MLGRGEVVYENREMLAAAASRAPEAHGLDRRQVRLRDEADTSSGTSAGPWLWSTRKAETSTVHSPPGSRSPEHRRPAIRRCLAREVSEERAACSADAGDDLRLY